MTADLSPVSAFTGSAEVGDGGVEGSLSATFATGYSGYIRRAFASTQRDRKYQKNDMELPHAISS